ncbi:MAG TPA: oxygenase MpaB family protein [Candidatus Dormibacteraeota bacterium]|jgi:uncharacterized protein (DUF2236 family)|nr:oxygenase MpaB family protein [Candidatus Dormibacteraeota bacterium]
MASRHARWEPLGDLMAVLVGPPPGSASPPLLADHDADAGLFGPGSVTWQVAREPFLLVGGGRALLMQVAHPLVAQGVVDHSNYESDPFGRLVRTVRWLVAVTFGTTAEARTASREVRRVHAAVRGTLQTRNATGDIPAGTPYDAADAELSRWVLATIVQSMLSTYEAMVGPLPGDRADRFVREWRAVAPLVAVPPAGTWDTAQHLHDYVAMQVRALQPVAASREAARVVLRPPLPSRALRPVTGSVAFLTTGLLPASMRRAYGLRWTSAHAAAHRATCVAMRQTHRVLPRRLRVSSLYDAALMRSQGQGLPRRI